MLTCSILLEGFSTATSPWPCMNCTCREPPLVHGPQLSFFSFISILGIKTKLLTRLFFFQSTQHTIEMLTGHFSQTYVMKTYVLANLRGSFLWVFSSNLRDSRLINSVLNTQSRRLSYSCSWRIIKSSCRVLHARESRRGKRKKGKDTLTNHFNTKHLIIHTTTRQSSKHFSSCSHQTQEWRNNDFSVFQKFLHTTVSSHYTVQCT